MRIHQQGRGWKSEVPVQISTSQIRFHHFLKKTLVIANDCAALQAEGFGMKQLTSNNLRFAVIARSILDSSPDPRLRVSFTQLQETSKGRDNFVHWAENIVQEELIET